MNLLVSISDPRITECLGELGKKVPSPELEAEHKAKYGFSDETYQKILSFYQSMIDLGLRSSTELQGIFASQGIDEMSPLIVETTLSPGQELEFWKMMSYVYDLGDGRKTLPFAGVRNEKRKDGKYDVVFKFNRHLTLLEILFVRFMTKGYCRGN